MVLADDRGAEKGLLLTPSFSNLYFIFMQARFSHSEAFPARCRSLQQPLSPQATTITPCPRCTHRRLKGQSCPVPISKELLPPNSPYLCGPVDRCTSVLYETAIAIVGRLKKRS